MVRRWAPLVAPLFVVLAYFRVLDAPFVWDDRHLIEESPRVATLQPIATYFGSAFWNSPGTADQRGYYRPLTIWSLALDHAAHGDNPAGFHLTNVVLHALNAALLYALMRRSRVRPACALGLASLWALAPRLTEAAAWISGRTDVLATTFVLLALLVYRPQQLVRVVAASLLVLFGLFAKEVALAGTVALVAMELLASRRAPMARRILGVAAPLASLALYFLLRQAALPRGGSPWETELGPGRRALLVLAAVGEYARMAALPWSPELQIGDIRAPPAASISVGVLVVVALVALILRAPHLWLRERANVRTLLVTGTALAVTAIGLVAHIFPLAVNVLAADRFLYLPLAGLALALAPCAQLARIRGVWKAAVAGSLIVSFFAATWVRVGSWGNEIDLWTRTYRQNNGASAIALNELGGVYYRAGLFAEAASLLARQVRIARDPTVARANHANALGELGEYAASAIELSSLCDDSDRANVCLFAGLAELRLLRFESAETLLRVAVSRAHGDYAQATATLEVVPRAAHLTRSASYAAADPWTRFEVDALVGRRVEALRSAEAILGTPGAPVAERREAARYWALLGPPRDVPRVLEASGASDVLDPATLEGARLRARTAQDLIAAWGGLGVAE